jgi:predicted peptidase
MPTFVFFAVLASLLHSAALASAAPLGPGHHALVAKVPQVGELRYTLTVPEGYDPKQPAALVLALHPGGDRPPYYGGQFVGSVFGPGVSDLRPIIVAPDCPAPSWADPLAERAVLALLDQVMKEYTINRKRVLVVGFSMGGRGTWYFSARHADLFTAAIPIAGSTSGEDVSKLATIPTYIIHSQRDEVVPFQPAKQVAQDLKQLGRTVEFEALSDATHFAMQAYVPALRRAVKWVQSQWK